MQFYITFRFWFAQIVMKKNIIKILAIPGSLREKSSSNVIMYAAAHLLPVNVEIEFYNGISLLPHFNDSDYTPESITDLRDKISNADGVFICTPEYAFGIPGSLKNALDWTVGSGELTNKPVAVVTAASVGDKAHAALLLVLSALSSKVNPNATLLIPFIRTKVKNGEVIDQDILKQLQAVLASLVQTIQNQSDTFTVEE
jgi:chromate reductase, NAD(P)H dehydrogenase (quinone)